MTNDFRTDVSTKTVDDIQDAIGETSTLGSLGQEGGSGGCDLRGFGNNSAASGESRSDLWRIK
jgi:hypothetical protein